MIHAENLTLEYPTRSEPTIEGVSMTVDDGEALGVLGAVESGKTSLAMAVAGFAPSVTGGRVDGELSVAGHDPRETDDDTRVGMVFEDYSAQLTQVRVIDEVMVPLLSRGLERERARERAHELLERVRLDGYAERRTWELSGGEQQRVAIAAVLAMDADAVVFDTATRALDPEGREDVTNLVASLREEKTLLVTATEPEELVGITDRVLVLDDGKRAAFGSADEILRDHDLLERVGLRPPAALRAARGLGFDSDPVTAGEFAASLDREPRRDAATSVGDATDIEGAARDAFAADADSVPSPDGGDAAVMEADAGRADHESDDPLLRIDGVEFSYDGDENAIDGIDLAVPPGEVHALIGGNGAGKSTLVELVVGLLDPDGGEIRIGGEPTSERTAAAIGETAALSFQNPDEQLSKRTVREELRFPLEERQHERSLLPFGGEQRYGEAHIEERVEDARSLTGLDESLLAEDPTFLPQGYRRLAAVASALAPDPDVVILDEPTVGLDAEGYENVAATVERLSERGKAVLLVEHDMDFVCRVADRVSLLSDGRTAERGPPAEVFDPAKWEALREQYVRPPRAAELADCLGVDALTLDGLLERSASVTEVAE